ncbi:hypothetical protein HK405_014406, partial [Cladochytrium tenue]
TSRSAAVPEKVAQELRCRATRATLRRALNALFSAADAASHAIDTSADGADDVDSGAGPNSFATPPRNLPGPDRLAEGGSTAASAVDADDTLLLLHAFRDDLVRWGARRAALLDAAILRLAAVAAAAAGPVDRDVDNDVRPTGQGPARVAHHLAAGRSEAFHGALRSALARLAEMQTEFADRIAEDLEIDLRLTVAIPPITTTPDDTGKVAAAVASVSGAFAAAAADADRLLRAARLKLVAAGLDYGPAASLPAEGDAVSNPAVLRLTAHLDGILLDLRDCEAHVAACRRIVVEGPAAAAAPRLDDAESRSHWTTAADSDAAALCDGTVAWDDAAAAAATAITADAAPGPAAVFEADAGAPDRGTTR